MQIGMNLPVMVPGLDRTAILEWSRRIEASPFSHIAAGERINFPNPEILVALSAAAAVTERVKIVTNVIVLPMHGAVLKAKQLATLDVVSGGRLVAGVGAGAREDDFRACGAEFGGRRLAQLADQVEQMRRVWSGEMVVPGALRPVEPAPVQPTGPPVLAGSISPRSIEKAATWADGLLGFSFTASAAEVEQGFTTARRAWKDAGRDRPPQLWTGCWFALGDEARSQLDGYLHRYLNFMGPGVAEKLAPSVPTITPAALRDFARRVEDLGADELSLTPTTLDPDEVQRAADALA